MLVDEHVLDDDRLILFDDQSLDSSQCGMLWELESAQPPLCLLDKDVELDGVIAPRSRSFFELNLSCCRGA